MPPRSRFYGWYILGLLATVNFFNYANRNVVFPVYDDLRAAFGFSNAELGLLGTAFMLSHALVTVPIGWAGDRLDRRKVMALGLVVWSLSALASAVATGLGTMLLARAMVGVGTATCVPLANALLSDVFPQQDKARTISIFNVGLFLGGAGGFAVGALMGFPLGFIVLALPGVALAVFVYTLDVPPRRPHAPAASLAELRSDMLEIVRIPTMRWLLVAAVLMAFAAGGYVSWFADFVAEEKGYTIENATLIFGVCAVTGGLAGVLSGGVVGDYLYKQVPFGRLAAMCIGFSCSVPFAVVAILVDTGPVFLISAWLMMFFITWYHGPMAAVVDDLVSDEWAATAQATFIFIMHLVGTAPSSYVVGVLADEVGVRYALFAPTLALGLAAAAVAMGFRTVQADRRAASVGEPVGTAL